MGHEAKPTFTDLDGDGRLDLLIGEYAGNINYWESNSTTINSSCVITTNAVVVSETSAEFGGIVTNNNSHLVTRRGICYSATNTEPTLANTQAVIGSGLGTFSDIITGLSSDLVYYVSCFFPVARWEHSTERLSP